MIIGAVFAVGYPIIIAVILILIGIVLFLRRTRSGIQTKGEVVGIAKHNRKYTKLKLDVEAPIVRYTVNGTEYTGAAAKFRMNGTGIYEKGDIIDIRVSKKNPRVFEPRESGDTAEKLFITGGIFVIIAYIAVYIRYGRYL